MSWCRSCSSPASCSRYFVVLPSAIDFLQNFNDDNFDILLQAKDYYRFAILLLAAMGARLPDPRRGPGADAHGDRDGRAAAREPAATRCS